MDWINNVFSIVVVAVAGIGSLFFVAGLLKAASFLHDRQLGKEERRLSEEYYANLHRQLEEWHRRMTGMRP